MLRMAARNFSIVSPLGDDIHNFPDFYGNPASVFNLLASALGEAVRRNAKSLGKFSVAKHNHIVLRLLYHAPLVQQFRGHLFVSTEVPIQRSNADLDPALLKDVRETSLRQPPVQRHLAAFEANLA